MHLHGHERFDMNNDELLGIIWEHRKKKKGKGGIFLGLERYYTCRINNNLHIGSNKHKSLF